jgi:hypothetical protein
VVGRTTCAATVRWLPAQFDHADPAGRADAPAGADPAEPFALGIRRNLLDQVAACAYA